MTWTQWQSMRRISSCAKNSARDWYTVSQDNNKNNKSSSAVLRQQQKRSARTRARAAAQC